MRRLRTLLLLLASTSLLLAPGAAAGNARDLLAQGRRLYAEGCISCHGVDGRGVRPGTSGGVSGRDAFGPSLRGVGAASVDFHLAAGYMPLRSAADRPVRSEPAYTEEQIRALVGYVTSFSGRGPPIPDVHPERGDVAAGFRAFTTFCAGCHQSLGEGGIAGGGSIAPPLGEATARQIAEAIRVGPNVMPRFPERLLDDRSVDSIAAYVLQARSPRDPGGAALGHIGPVVEGLVGWAATVLVLVALARVLGRKAG